MLYLLLLKREYMHTGMKPCNVIITPFGWLTLNRALMGMHSSVFRSMLYNGMKESSQKEITLEDVDKETFLHLLGCIYTQ